MESQRIELTADKEIRITAPKIVLQGTDNKGSIIDKDGTYIYGSSCTNINC